ncbi:MAG: glycosyltransferase [Clostridia bacterium]|nr:glycosyltransferase [Clostridia bacterium]
MKILQINAVYNLSSTGKISTDFQNYINNKTEHTCKTAFSYGGNKEDGYIIGSQIDRKIHGFLSRLTGKQAWFSAGSTKKLIKFIDEYSPDIIQLGNLHGNYLNFPMLMNYIAEKDIATVFTLHDCWPFTGKCCHYTADKCYKWQTGCYDCPRLEKDNASWGADKTKELWQAKRNLFSKIPRLAVVGVSKWIVNESKKSPLMENVKIFDYIYNGIDANVFQPNLQPTVREKYNLQDKKILLGVASGWQECKGLFNIVELSKNLPDDCQIVLVGNINEQIPECSILNIPATENVQELVEWYSAADVLINMSKEETFGKVSAEALMCGTPVVCFNSTANPELVGENCGLVCETEDVLDFKELVLEVLNNGKEKYFNSCINFAKANFVTEKSFEKYVQLYADLLEI